MADVWEACRLPNDKAALSMAQQLALLALGLLKAKGSRLGGLAGAESVLATAMPVLALGLSAIDVL